MSSFTLRSPHHSKVIRLSSSTPVHGLSRPHCLVRKYTIDYFDKYIRLNRSWTTPKPSYFVFIFDRWEPEQD